MSNSSSSHSSPPKSPPHAELPKCAEDKPKPFYRKKKPHKNNTNHPEGTKNKAAAASANKNNKPAVKKIKEQAFLCIHLAVSGRSPVNGWIMSFGATIISAKRRAVLAAMERHCLPLRTSPVSSPPLPPSAAVPSSMGAYPAWTFDDLAAGVTPAADVAGFWRARRTDLEYMSRQRVPAAQAFQELQTMCAPYAALTLVANPLLSVYGWLSYYWTALFPNTEGGASTAAMPWGFSGLCARSFACGVLGCSPKALSAHPVYQASFQGFDNSGSVLPLGDALTTAVSFSYLHCLSQSCAAAATEADPAAAAAATQTAAPPAVQIECALPPVLAALQCVPASDNALTAERKKELFFDYIIDERIRHGFAHHCCSAAGDTSTTAAPPSSSVSSLEVTQPFVEYPSITDILQHTNFLTTLEAALTPTTGTIATTPWVATEKVHGANFTIYTDGAEIWAGKRTGYLALAHSPSFFDFVYLLESHKEAILAIHEQTVAWLTAQETQHGGAMVGGARLVVSIVCELAGGTYPHPRVPLDLRGVVVQRGVYYAPFNFLYGFDIAVEAAAVEHRLPHYYAALRAREAALTRAIKAEQGSAAAAAAATAPAVVVQQLSLLGKDGRYYLPFRTTCDIFRAARFTFAEVLLTQTTGLTAAEGERGGEKEGLREFLARADPEQLRSQVATHLFGLPLLPDNKAEGYVLRPEEDLWICCSTNSNNNNNDRSNNNSESNSTTSWSRVIIKQKHPRFAEFMRTPTPNTSVNNSTTTASAATMTATEDFLTAARVESVLSKYTTEEQRDREKMVAAVLADARKDAERFRHESN